MVRHNVYFELPTRELGKVDAKFVIYQNEDKLGEITISKGAVEDNVADKQNPINLGWGKFDRFMASSRK